jgi:hypothetical protein
MKSIISNEKRCYLCGTQIWIEIHHVYGASNRNNSELYGLTVPLCRYCHNEPPNGVHYNKANNLALQSEVQKKAMRHYRWTEDEFREIFHKSYL